MKPINTMRVGKEHWPLITPYMCLYTRYLDSSVSLAGVPAVCISDTC